MSVIQDKDIIVQLIALQVVAEARTILHPSSITGNLSPPQIHVGHPISATLYIKSSLYRCYSDHKQMRYRLRYDFEEQTRDWLICGRKRGEAIVEVWDLTILRSAHYLIELIEWASTANPLDVDCIAPWAPHSSQGRCKAITYG